ncbi:glutamate 5-kinase [Thalassotalea ganghwensis]
MSFTDTKRLVIKVGSALIAPEKQGCSTEYLKNIAHFIHACNAKGIQVILVSSGSVAAGNHLFDCPKPTTSMKKAMAAAGQTNMMAVWDELLEMPLAQILLTHGDLCDRERYLSIKETIESLLANNIMPIINENDTVTSDELKVGDNDNLSAMAAAAIDADTLIMCTDVSGLYNKNPNQHQDAFLINEVPEITPLIYQMAGGAVSDTGTGGMKTKIEAAEKATAHGINTYIINGFNASSFTALLDNENPGTRFLPSNNPLPPTVHWMTHTVRESGEVIIDESQTDLTDNGELLTSENIVEVKGQFAAGDTILVTTDDGKWVAKAQTKYSSCLLNYVSQEQADSDHKDHFHPQNTAIISTEHLAVLEDA